MYCGGKTDWFELPATGRIHSWTVCYFAAEEFLKEVPFTLVLVEFDGVNTLFLSRLIGLERKDIQIGMQVKPRFRRKATWSVRDVYFVKSEAAAAESTAPASREQVGTPLSPHRAGVVRSSRKK